jgi:hypothetical protein
LNTRGEKIGVLTRGKLKDDIVAKMKLSERWNFPIDVASRVQEAEVKGEEIIKNIKTIINPELNDLVHCIFC